MQKSHNKTEASLNNSEKSDLETDYYPSDREILAAKASEIVAEAIRASVSMPCGERLHVFYTSKADVFVIKHQLNDETLSTLYTHLEDSGSSRALDSMLELVKGFGEGAL